MITIHVFEMNVPYFRVCNWIQLFVSTYNSVTTTGNDFNFEFNGGEIILT